MNNGQTDRNEPTLRTDDLGQHARKRRAHALGVLRQHRLQQANRSGRRRICRRYPGALIRPSPTLRSLRPPGGRCAPELDRACQGVVTALGEAPQRPGCMADSSRARIPSATPERCACRDGPQVEAAGEHSRAISAATQPTCEARVTLRRDVCGFSASRTFGENDVQ